MNNLELWDKVKSPDPKYTKGFSRGGGFKGTATNTQYIVRTATELWGPNGTGWGVEQTQEQYVDGAPIIIDGNVVGREVIHVVRGCVWYIDSEGKTRKTSQQYGQTTFVGRNKNGVFTDEEAPKKSVTDMMLKCMSLLGFSADIFLGLWDDNKYVNDVRSGYDASQKKPGDNEKKMTSADWITVFDAECEKTTEGIKRWRMKNGSQILATIANKEESAKLRGYLDDSVKACMEAGK